MGLYYKGAPLGLDRIDHTLKRLVDNTLSVTVPTRGIVTQEEYDALPQDEKVNGVYFISDETDAALGAVEIYSEKEHVVGRWIDGRPIYRRTCSGVSPAAGKIEQIMDLSESNIDWAVKGYGFIESTLDMRLVPIPTTRSSTIACLVGINQDRSALNLYSLGGDFASKPFSYTLEYTKTTDPSMIDVASAVPAAFALDHNDTEVSE